MTALARHRQVSMFNGTLFLFEFLVESIDVV